MNDPTYPAGPAMLKIDGAKVRAIREKKGLTQLYVATVVEVTTDTVSRWENKRYPTIKKENGLKLAEALEVELDDILDRAEAEEPSAQAETDADKEPVAVGTSATTEIIPTAPWHRKPGHLGVFVLILATIASIWAALHYLAPGPSISRTTATRIVSPHFIPGRPLPVFLKITTPGPEPASIILKEQVPPGSTLSDSFPPSSGTQSGTIKWLTKVAGAELFYYTITTEPSFSGKLSFSGTVHDGNGGEPAVIDGGSSSSAGLHHWADTDGDNRISDAEILEVYDLVANDNPSTLDLDLLEEMWLGEGYLWQADQQQFSILQ